MMACEEKGCPCAQIAKANEYLENQIAGHVDDYDNTRYDNYQMRELLIAIGVCVSNGDFSVPEFILVELGRQGFIAGLGECG